MTNFFLILVAAIPANAVSDGGGSGGENTNLGLSLDGPIAGDGLITIE